MDNADIVLYCRLPFIVNCPLSIVHWKEMRSKNILFAVLLVLGAGMSARAQFVGEAIVFSQENNGGTARFKAMGNAKTALGGDMSSITGNPAGLGFFGRSDISLTLNYNNAGNRASYLGSPNITQNKGRFGVDHAGMVFHFPTAGNGGAGWQNFNLGLSYENTNTFTENLRYEGENPNSTILSAHIDDGNQNFLDDLWEHKLIEKHQGPSKAYFPVVREKGEKGQLSDVLNTGFNSRVAMAFGANYNNSFYIGGTLGLTSFRYGHSSWFSEWGLTKDRAAILEGNPNSSIADVNHDDYDYVEANYDMTDDYLQETEGSGIDLKLGMLFKPAVDWNIGLTIATPTWITVDDYTRRFVEVDYFDVNDPNWNPYFKTPERKTEDRYRLITPWKFGLGLSKFFGRGLLSADVEYVDYGSIKLRTMGNTDPGLETEWDWGIGNAYQRTVNLRVGGELLFTNALSGRAGFNHYGNPYRNADNEQYSGSVGLGIKLSRSTYIDLAVVHLVNTYKISPYTFDEALWDSTWPVADVRLQRTNAVLTFGAKF